MCFRRRRHYPSYLRPKHLNLKHPRPKHLSLSPKNQTRYRLSCRSSRMVGSRCRSKSPNRWWICQHPDPTMTGCFHMPQAPSARWRPRSREDPHHAMNEISSATSSDVGHPVLWVAGSCGLLRLRGRRRVGRSDSRRPCRLFARPTPARGRQAPQAKPRERQTSTDVRSTPEPMHVCHESLPLPVVVAGTDSARCCSHPLR